MRYYYDLYIDTQSALENDGKTYFYDKLERPGETTKKGFSHMLENLKPDDEVVIPTIAVFGVRNAAIMRAMKEIKMTGAHLIVLDSEEIFQDSDDVLKVLEYLDRSAQKIRLRKQRSMKAVIKAGRPQKERPEQYDELAKMYRRGALSLREAAKKLGVAHTTFRNWIELDEFDELADKAEKMLNESDDK